MNKIKRLLKRKPHFIFRLLLVIVLAGIASVKNNPIIRAEAMLGLSPSKLELIFGIKSLFSGMTEGVHQFLRLNIESSVRANVFSPFLCLITTYMILAWRFPKMDTKVKEYTFFSIFILLSVVVNIVN